MNIKVKHYCEQCGLELSPDTDGNIPAICFRCKGIHNDEEYNCEECGIRIYPDEDGNVPAVCFECSGGDD